MVERHFMYTHYFQHVPFEGLGSIEEWLTSEGYTIGCTRFFESDLLPDLETLDFLIIVGGPMSVNDEGKYPWLKAEKAFIRKVIELEIPVLGICLGAQLIANCLGSTIFANHVKEIGWFPIYANPETGGECFQFPEKINVLHWHGETFDLPPDAVLLVSSDGCENQGFQVGHSTIGLQFHLEMRQEDVGNIVNNCRDELQQGQFIQSKTEIVSTLSAQYDVAHEQMKNLLTYLTSGKCMFQPKTR